MKTIAVAILLLTACGSPTVEETPVASGTIALRDGATTLVAAMNVSSATTMGAGAAFGSTAHPPIGVDVVFASPISSGWNPAYHVIIRSDACADPVVDAPNGGGFGIHCNGVDGQPMVLTTAEFVFDVVMN